MRKGFRTTKEGVALVCLVFGAVFVIADVANASVNSDLDEEAAKSLDVVEALIGGTSNAVGLTTKSAEEVPTADLMEATPSPSSSSDSSDGSSRMAPSSQIGEQGVDAKAGTLSEFDVPPNSRLGVNDSVLKDFVGKYGPYSDELLRLAPRGEAASAAAIAKLKVLGALQGEDGKVDWARVAVMEALQGHDGRVNKGLYRKVKGAVDSRSGRLAAGRLRNLASKGEIPYDVARALIRADKLRAVQRRRRGGTVSLGVEAASTELDEETPQSDVADHGILSGAFALLKNPQAARLVPELVMATRAHDMHVKHAAEEKKRKAKLAKKRHLEIEDIIKAVKEYARENKKNDKDAEGSTRRSRRMERGHRQGSGTSSPAAQHETLVPGDASEPDLAENSGDLSNPPDIPMGPTQAEIKLPTSSAEGRAAVAISKAKPSAASRPCKEFTHRWMCVLQDISRRKQMLPKGSIVPVPGVQFIGQGFDSITGDNRAPVLKFMNEQSPTSWRKVPELAIIAGYEYPVGVFCDPVAEFQDESTEQTITNSEQAEKHSSMKFGLKFMGGMMSMSKESSSTRSSLQENYINEVSKVINLFSVRISDGHNGPLDPEFLKDLSELPSEYNREQYRMPRVSEFNMISFNKGVQATEPYRRFIQRYGTHFTSQVNMGGSVKLRCETEKKSAEESDSSAMKAQAEVDLSKLMGIAGAAFAGPAAVMVAKQADLKVGGGGAKSSSSSNKNFESKTTKKVTIEGGDPPLVVDGLSADELYKWYYSISENPAVMSSKTIPIIDLIANAEGVPNAKQVYENLRAAYDDFYADAGILAALKDSEASHQYKLDKMRTELDKCQRDRKEMIEKEEQEAESGGVLKSIGKAIGRVFKMPTAIRNFTNKLKGDPTSPVSKLSMLERSLKEDIKGSCVKLCDIKAQVSYYLDKMYGDDFGDGSSCKLACAAAAGETLSSALGLKINTGLVDETVRNFMTVLHQQKQAAIDTDHQMNEDSALHLLNDLFKLTNDERLVFKANFAKETAHTLEAVMAVKCTNLKAGSDGTLCPQLFQLASSTKVIVPDCTPSVEELAKWQRVAVDGGDIEFVKMLMELNPRAMVALDKEFEKTGGLDNIIKKWGEDKKDGEDLRPFTEDWEDSEQEIIKKVALLAVRLKVEKSELPPHMPEPEECKDLQMLNLQEKNDKADVFDLRITFQEMVWQFKDYHMDKKSHTPAFKMLVWVSPYQDASGAQKTEEKSLGGLKSLMSGDEKLTSLNLENQKVEFKFPMDSRQENLVHVRVLGEDNRVFGEYVENVSDLSARVHQQGKVKEGIARLTTKVAVEASERVLHEYSMDKPALIFKVSLTKVKQRDAVKWLMNKGDDHKGDGHKGDDGKELELLEEYHRGAQFLFGTDDMPTGLKSYRKYRGPPLKKLHASGLWASDRTGTYSLTSLLQEGAHVMTKKSSFRAIGAPDLTVPSQRHTGRAGGRKRLRLITADDDLMDSSADDDIEGIMGGN